MTQELKLKPKNAKSNLSRVESPTKKSAVESFRETHIKDTSTNKNILPEVNVEIEDPLISIKIPTPPLDFYNQPTSQAATSTKLEDPSLRCESLRRSIPLSENDIPTTFASLVSYAPMDAPVVFDKFNTNGLKSCLKQPGSVSTKRKNVEFRFDQLVETRYFVSDENKPPQIPVQPTQSLEEIELSICEEILRWDLKWLNMPTPPDEWKNTPMKSSYESLQQYKSLLRPLIRIEVLSKLKNSNSNRLHGEKEFFPLLVKSRQSQGNRIRFNFQSKELCSLSQGMLLILRVKDLTKASTASSEIDFFGYVRELKLVDIHLNVTVDIINRELPQNISVIKCKPLMNIFNDIKLMVATENIQESPLIERFLKPETNSLSSWPTDLNFETILDKDQKEIVNVITSECLTNRKIANIIALNSKAGTGKTKVLIESLISIIDCSRRDSEPKFSILVCAMSNILADLIALETSKHKILNKKSPSSKNQAIKKKESIKVARIGNRDKMSQEAQKMHVSQYETLKDYDVIFTTVTNSYELYNYKRNFDVCFVDDANCCIDSELAIILQFNITKLFLFGDLKQTQPLAHSHDLLDSRYDETLFKKLVKVFEEKQHEEKPILELTSQRRMTKELSEIVDK